MVTRSPILVHTLYISFENYGIIIHNSLWQEGLVCICKEFHLAIQTQSALISIVKGSCSFSQVYCNYSRIILGRAQQMGEDVTRNVISQQLSLCSEWKMQFFLWKSYVSYLIRYIVYFSHNIYRCHQMFGYMMIRLENIINWAHVIKRQNVSSLIGVSVLWSMSHANFLSGA